MTPREKIETLRRRLEEAKAWRLGNERDMRHPLGSKHAQKWALHYLRQRLVKPDGTTVAMCARKEYADAIMGCLRALPALLDVAEAVAEMIGASYGPDGCDCKACQICDLQASLAQLVAEAVEREEEEPRK